MFLEGKTGTLTNQSLKQAEVPACLCTHRMPEHTARLVRPLTSC